MLPTRAYCAPAKSAAALFSIRKNSEAAAVAYEWVACCLHDGAEKDDPDGIVELVELRG
jgi:hypothetical protein